MTAKMSPGPSFVTFQASGSLAPRSALPHRVSLSPPRCGRSPHLIFSITTLSDEEIAANEDGSGKKQES